MHHFHRLTALVDLFASPTKHFWKKKKKNNCLISAAVDLFRILIFKLLDIFKMLLWAILIQFWIICWFILFYVSKRWKIKARWGADGSDLEKYWLPQTMATASSISQQLPDKNSIWFDIWTRCDRINVPT